jgi:hypothetical protein
MRYAVVEIGAVFDRVDAGLTGPKDALTAVSVGGDLST